MSHDHGHPPRIRGGTPEPPPLARRAWMKTPGEAPRTWDLKRNVDRLLYVLYGACAGLVALDLIVHRHIGHPWERWFAFHAWYGFVSCWLLVLAAKQLRRLLMRPEDYYDG